VCHSWNALLEPVVFSHTAIYLNQLFYDRKRDPKGLKSYARGPREIHIERLHSIASSSEVGSNAGRMGAAMSIWRWAKSLKVVKSGEFDYSDVTSARLEILEKAIQALPWIERLE